MSRKVSITKKQSKSPSKGKFCIGHSVGQPCLTPLMHEPMIFRNEATLSDHNYKYHLDMVYDPLTMIQLPDKGYYEWTITRPNDDKMVWIIERLDPGIYDLVNNYVENYQNYDEYIVDRQIIDQDSMPKEKGTTDDLNEFGEQDETDEA